MTIKNGTIVRVQIQFGIWHGAKGILLDKIHNSSLFNVEVQMPPRKPFRLVLKENEFKIIYE